MPDTNVLQLATVVVLLLVLLVLVVLTQTMSRIEKSLKGGAGEADEAPEPETKTQAASPEPVKAKKRSRRSRRRRGKQDEDEAPEALGGGTAVAGAAGAGALAAAAEAQAEPEPQSQAPGSEVATASEGRVQSHPLETAAAEEAAARAAQAPSSLRDLPQDEPFERDGRWWFVRGDELLVYDEGTGQWMPGDHSVLGLGGASEPQSQTPGPAQDATVQAQGDATRQPVRDGATSEMPVVGGGYQLDDSATAAPSSDRQEQGDQAQGGFWKCPSCGAVNGSTSATCRMCFTPRS